MSDRAAEVLRKLARMARTEEPWELRRDILDDLIDLAREEVRGDPDRRHRPEPTVEQRARRYVRRIDAALRKLGTTERHPDLRLVRGQDGTWRAWTRETPGEQPTLGTSLEDALHNLGTKLVDMTKDRDSPEDARQEP